MDKPKSTFDERLKNHPELRARFEAILDIAEGEAEGPDTADSVEEKVIEEVKKLGQEIMQEWAEDKADKETKAIKKERPKSQISRKKKSTG